MAPATESRPVLPASDWQSRQAAHEARVRQWTDPQQARSSRGEKHPVHDFLFTYYSFRPTWLRRWHPGSDVLLGGDAAQEFLRHPGYREFENGVGLDVAAELTSRRTFVTWLRDLLAAMQTRPAFFGCYGLHEWAMVHRLAPEQIRHHAWPLRFPPDEIARIIEGSAICCTHFDAFRFFTAPARQLNRVQPTRESVPQLEQRGCLHATMDLYKWSFKLAPFTPSEWIADAFDLAWAVREVDMRASPYDLAALGYTAIPIETPAGRAEYEVHQRDFARRAEPLRARLLGLCERLLAESSTASLTGEER
jgi:hypothetical protein